MKKFFIYVVTLLMISSCSDVVQLDLNNSDPRLVVDASMELNDSGTTFTRVQLTRSAGFYDEEIVFVNDAIVSITDADGALIPIPFVADGVYSSGFPFIRMSNPTENNYTLTINDNGAVYTATESLEPTVPFTDVEQGTISGFGDDITEVTAFFNDPSGLGDFYLFEYQDVDNVQVDIIDDEFTDGNRSQTTFFIEEITPGATATIRILGIDQGCFNFYETLLQQAGDGGGGPFGTQPAVVRGNIINTTDSERFPFGYFRISEAFEIEYTIQ
ncbi:DUF4249 domain-containing protein [Nonlabens sp. Ci31]|uniref:DUF4249 family protein n=1 Tax=Nonlabens sp. Ci31 TaxID=2608253 RepID=UPI001464785E|nr:DUF4249 family protein [Nonlabens sp. Ci31]QJP34700.1 DUF4249 domain-containing protein [Nonlabens sp. Ci31]